MAAVIGSGRTVLRAALRTVLRAAGACWLLARAEWRARWMSLTVMTLMATLAGTVAVAAIAASRRADSAFDRFMERTRSPNLWITLGRPPEPEELRRTSQLPGVENAMHYALMLVAPDLAGFQPGVHTIALAVPQSTDPTPRQPGLVVEGRQAAADRDDEFMVNETMRVALHAHVGQRIRLVSLDNEQAKAVLVENRDPGPPAGPSVWATLVGVFRDAEDVSDAPEPTLSVTAAFYRAHAEHIGRLEGVMVRADETRLAAVDRDARHLLHLDAVPAETPEDLGSRIDPAVDVQVAGLTAFAVVATLAGLVAVGQSMARQAAASAKRNAILQALGMTRAHGVGVDVSVMAPVAVGAAGASALGAWALAPSLVTGVARSAEPDPGRWLDPVLFAAGPAAVGLAVLVLAAAMSAWSVITSRIGAPRHRRRLSAFPGSPLVAVGPARSLGIRMALEPRPGPGRAVDRRVPTRSALISAAAGIAGVVAVLSFSASVTHLMSTPRLSGALFDAELAPGEGELRPPEYVGWLERQAGRLAGEPEVTAVSAVRSGNVQLARTEGGTTVLTMADAVTERSGSLPPVLRTGRMPSGPADVALGSTIMSTLRLQLGDRVHVHAAHGAGALRVVGVYVSAATDDVNRGVLLADSGFDRLLGEPDRVRVRVRLAGRDTGSVLSALQRRYVGLFQWRTPSGVDNLDELGGLPWTVAAFLALLALAASVHALISGVRAWRHDLCVLRVLGFVPAQVRVAIRWQALTAATLGLVIGVPAGLAIARVGWARVADSLGVVDEPVIRWSTLGVVAALALVVAVLLALPPGVAAARTRPSEVLHAE